MIKEIKEWKNFWVGWVFFLNYELLKVSFYFLVWSGVGEEQNSREAQIPAQVDIYDLGV